MGLDEQSEYNLMKILNRLHKVTEPQIQSYESLFTQDEYALYQRVAEFGNEVKEISDGVYQYKHYKLPIKRFGNEVFLYRHGLDSLKTLDNIRNNKKAIFDIGAFVGDSALVLAEYFPQNPIYCFEPNTDNFTNAKTTFSLNKLDTRRIKLYNMALGASKGYGCMQTDVGGSVESHLEISADNVKQQGHVVDILPLDEFIQENSIEIGLIKIDVEGFEQSVLEGAIQTLNDQKPALLVSIYHNYEQFFGIKPWIDSLSIGYKFDFFWGVSGRINKEIMLLCEVR
jgi:FkbM family methyltransferase